MLIEVPGDWKAEDMEKLITYLIAQVNGTPARVIDARWSSPGIRTQASASFYGHGVELVGHRRCVKEDSSRLPERVLKFHIVKEEDHEG